MENYDLKSKHGWVVPIVTIVVALITVVGSVLGAQMASNSTFNQKVADVEKQAAVLDSRVTTNETNVKEDIARVEDKVDWLIRERGGIPSQVVANENQ
jgi:nitrogen fixation protein FixH